jgi:hypothetical protein
MERATISYKGKVDESICTLGIRHGLRAWWIGLSGMSCVEQLGSESVASALFSRKQINVKYRIIWHIRPPFVSRPPGL